MLVPAFARALRDPFVHARIAGLMALMATADCYEKEDLAGKVIPAMSICLVDRERYALRFFCVVSRSLIAVSTLQSRSGPRVQGY